MSHHPVPDGEQSPADQPPPTSALLRQAIEHVDQLLERLDHAPPNPADATPAAVPTTMAVPEGIIAARIAAVAAHLARPPGTAAQALAGGVQVVLLAHDLAERVRSQARQTSLDAATAGQRIIADATRAAAQLTADAKRNQAVCEAWANEMTRAADAAIHAVLDEPGLTAPSTPSIRVTGQADTQRAPPRPDFEAAIDSAVRDMDAVHVGRRRRTSGQH